MRHSIILFCASLLLALPSVRAQPTDSASVYKVKPWLSGGIAAVGLYANFTGLPKVKQKERLTSEELERLAHRGVSRFNQAGLNQDAARRQEAHRISDLLMYGTASLPFFLFLDDRVKPLYWKVSLMYLETIAVTSNLYTYSPLVENY